MNSLKQVMTSAFARRLPARCSNKTALTSPFAANLLQFRRWQDTAASQRYLLQVPTRCYSSVSGDGDERGPPTTRLPALMHFPEIVWPSVIKSIRNFILATFIVRPYFDRDFNLPDFVGGAKQALEVVSNKLSQGDTKSLEGLVQGDVIPKLASSVSLMSMMQRELIAINKEDIYFSFPYQIGIMFNDDEGPDQKRFVEITMVFHTLRGLSQMREKGEEPPLNMGMLPEYQKRISICNYRFIREYTKGVEGEWTINLLNHFRPTDSLPANNE